jgi:hypothetical protein
VLPHDDAPGKALTDVGGIDVLGGQVPLAGQMSAITMLAGFVYVV